MAPKRMNLSEEEEEKLAYTWMSVSEDGDSQSLEIFLEKFEVFSLV